jgi:hypothetical protein
VSIKIIHLVNKITHLKISYQINIQLARGSASCQALNLPLAEITGIQTFGYQTSKTAINFPL